MAFDYLIEGFKMMKRRGCGENGRAYLIREYANVTQLQGHVPGYMTVSYHYHVVTM